MNEDQARRLYEKYVERGEATGIESREYKIFKLIEKPWNIKIFEQLCKLSGSILKVKLEKEEKERLENAIRILNLDIAPEDISSLSLLSMIFFASLCLFGFIAGSLILVVMFVVCAIFAQRYVKNIPINAVRMRMIRASGDLILAILYMVIYMRHNPNLEKAVEFAADNLTGPLALDFQKLLWDVETRKYETLKGALDSYVLSWKDYSPHFVDAIYLIETSQLQTSEEKRLEILDMAVSRMLDGTYDSMSHFASGLREPVNALYMMGIILPILGLVLFPIFASFLSDVFNVNYVAVMYNVGLPLVVYFLGAQILKGRPTSFPAPNIEGHPDVPKKGCFLLAGINIPAILPAVGVFTLSMFIFYNFYLRAVPTVPSEFDIYWSMVPIIGISLTIFTYTKLASFQRMRVWKKIIEVEREFTDASFQLGNRISEGFPPEIAVEKVGNIMKKTEISNFFNVILVNMHKIGLSFDAAIFDKKYGAINLYPSRIIRSSMQVMVESARKSLKDAAISLINFSTYLRSMERINEKVRDVLDEVISSMRFQAAYITPIMCGVVVGLSALIIIILYFLQEQITKLSAASAEGEFAMGTWAFGMFIVSKSIPLYLLQIVVGIYMIEILLLISYILAEIERPSDETYRNHIISTMILPSIIIYIICSVVVTIMFTGIGRAALAIGEMF
ncbi:MAG: hypothetical protein OH319_01600 [Candidatus Parvarchaeota archaeon]|nr:hypothetical protein [Candidatus Jingweiarchaeum tengchongense]MCW1297734.1 hypothetical protein [Candidatus Jingweiarchaeum tengchongense]MCW1299744.1 hypothetical protein [Candidatus Jingweiarchaeum tengchongense]MCW1304285.1 hypothetical protein [Candidatus Jingweiarchaeum tengchongense]MCW1305312.1 hypothetical protein [Candidatus Jingweiarchaeum tengchongense]